jgi:hypothetical protein
MLMASSRPAAEKKIKQAVDRGVDFLKGVQRDNGMWDYADRDAQAEVGATALAAMTLLECGVPADDPAVERAAAAIRQASIALTHTYSISLAIMFLDRLGDANDELLIQSLAVRLLGGQNEQGGWTYQCPSLDEKEQRSLSNLRPQRNELVGRLDRPRAGTISGNPTQELPKEIRDQLARLNNRLALGAGRHPADNSNTQFAALGLWVARRHGIPVERAMHRLATRFRMSQAADGSWHYMSATSPGRVGSGTPAMTCAGLLALAVAHGTSQAVLHGRRAYKDPFAGSAKSGTNFGRDFAVRAGLLYLARYVGQPGFPTAGKRGMITAGPPDYYFFWSLERVAMIYGLKTIGKKDWYAWGSKILLDHQNPNGSWEGKYGGGVDTCFALLFLQRANVARDLTAALSGKVRDPADVQLKAGGVGGEGLLAHGSKAGEDKESKPAEKPKSAERGARSAERGARGAGRGGKSPPPAALRPPPAANPESKSSPAPTPPREDTEEKQAAQLAQQLIQAPYDKQESIINSLKEQKGVAHTDALALAIAQLKGPIKLKARDALAERLARMTAATLHEKLQEESIEVRRAAALACAMKEDKAFIPSLITLLEDRERPVSLAAHAALKVLTKQDFGPAMNADGKQRATAIARWKEWWKSQAGK